MTRLAYALGVDVGGTFTDFALISLKDGSAYYHKTSSTPDDPSGAVGRGIAELLAEAGVEPAQVSYFGHGTTVATNALIMGKMATTGLITTEGFRDILEIRRQRQPHNYNIRVPKPPPLVPRHLRRELRERTYLEDWERSVEPDMEGLQAIVDDFRDEGVEAVAVCFIHSYHNPAHEARVVHWLRERVSQVFVCASHEVSAEFREYERFSTTVLNASLGPVMSRYLDRMENGAATLGICPPTILQSNGGVVSPGEAGRLPVRTLASGPAAGVTGAARLSVAAGFPDIITFDVGGTSTDVCLIEDGRPLIARERQFGGDPVRFPMMDVHSVGAGGGSVAWIDAGGFLRVGPQSAGATPGPACYGIGGTEPTVTDANVVLGRLNQEVLLGGRMPIKADLAHAAVEARIASPLGMSVEEAAEGILTILNENLVQAIRVISVERGFDPRGFALVAFGGAGPLLASTLAGELGIGSVIVPTNPGVLCALGLLVADVRSDFGLTRIMNLDRASPDDLNRAVSEVAAEAVAWFERERVPPRKRNLVKAIDMRYVGQSHELTVELPDELQRRDFTERDRDPLVRAFLRDHEHVYGYAPEAPIQLVTFRVSARADVSRPPLVGDAVADGGDAEAARTGTRRIHFTESHGYVDSPVYDRARLTGSAEILGPAIVEQMDATTVILPGQIARQDPAGNLVLTPSIAAGVVMYGHGVISGC